LRYFCFSIQTSPSSRSRWRARSTKALARPADARITTRSKRLGRPWADARLGRRNPGVRRSAIGSHVAPASAKGSGATGAIEFHARQQRRGRRPNALSHCRFGLEQRPHRADARRVASSSKAKKAASCVAIDAVHGGGCPRCWRSRWERGYCGNRHRIRTWRRCRVLRAGCRCSTARRRQVGAADRSGRVRRQQGVGYG
jgi:hypothetical protein